MNMITRSFYNHCILLGISSSTVQNSKPPGPPSIPTSQAPNQPNTDDDMAFTYIFLNSSAKTIAS